jgi:hypothetical protein
MSGFYINGRMREMKREHLEADAVKGLFRLRRQVGGSSQDALAAVDVMHRVCEELDKGVFGEQAINALLDLWQELKLKEVTGESISTLRAVVARIHEKSLAENS